MRGLSSRHSPLSPASNERAITFRRHILPVIRQLDRNHHLGAGGVIRMKTGVFQQSHCPEWHEISIIIRDS